MRSLQQAGALARMWLGQADRSSQAPHGGWEASLFSPTAGSEALELGLLRVNCVPSVDVLTPEPLRLGLEIRSLKRWLCSNEAWGPDPIDPCGWCPYRRSLGHRHS